MAEVIKKIKCHPLFPAIVSGASNTLLTVSSAVSLYIYFTDMAGNDFWHWQLVAYILMLASGITGFSEFFDEDSFYPLRDLLDYIQVVLVLPCYAAQMWIKTEMGPPELALVHAGLGIIGAIMYVVLESKRPDLSDLAVFSNGISLLFMAALSANPITLIAASVFIAGYCLFKRPEDQCCLEPPDKFNFVMAAFALISLASFDDELVQNIQDTVKNIISG